jgi:1-deoxy-D-xylulose-5-phosphate reductoisomerase
VYNAANERAVALFLEGHISFGDIAAAVEEALDSLVSLPSATRSDIMQADVKARRLVETRFECSRS